MTPVTGKLLTLTLVRDSVVAAVSVTNKAIPDLRVTVTSAFAQGPLAAAEGAPGHAHRPGGTSGWYARAALGASGAASGVPGVHRPRR